jgi:S1-C subfamily serine protease
MMNRDGASLGVMPDYSYAGDGFRIDGVREGQPAYEGGMEAGDIIIQMGDYPVSDIYSYMEGLSEYEKGDQIIVRVLRDGTELDIEITF